MNINAEEEINKRAKKVSRDDMEDLLGKESTAERLSKKAGFPLPVLGGHQDIVLADPGLVQRVV